MGLEGKVKACSLIISSGALSYRGCLNVASSLPDFNGLICSLSTLSYSDLSRFAGIFFMCNKIPVTAMPRRKTIQPEPLERFVFDDIEVEIRDADTWPIG